jgi:cell division protein FtsW (lipid II flippase)
MKVIAAIATVIVMIALAPMIIWIVGLAFIIGVAASIALVVVVAVSSLFDKETKGFLDTANNQRDESYQKAIDADARWNADPRNPKNREV